MPFWRNQVTGWLHLLIRMFSNTVNLANVIFDLIGIIALIIAIAYLAMMLFGYMLLSIFKGGK
jgi:flagellar biogenesis protein FliO